MASTRQLKTRIRSVKNTKQITKAMQMVAASKMRKAQEAQSAGKAYYDLASELLAYFASQGITDEHPLFVVRPIEKRLVIAIASDRGLAGSYNVNVIKNAIEQVKSDKAHKIETHVIEIGQKVGQAMAKINNLNRMGTYTDLPDNPDGTEMVSVVKSAIQMFKDGKFDAVDVVYTQFINSMKQEVVAKRLLPAGVDCDIEVSKTLQEAKYEPSPKEVLDGVAARLIKAKLFQCMIEARASEHSMRMMAMKNATDSASDIADDLTLEMNKARQAAVTQELSEISGAVEAMK